jgi:antitoxin component of MazEF toxin-antitoxin module
MPRRKLEDRNVRKILKNGSSYSVTIPIGMMRELGWKLKQKVTFRRKGKTLIIDDWEG